MEQDNKIKNRIVETYAEDMAKVIEDDRSGLIKKIIHEEEKHEVEKKKQSPESIKNKFFMLMSIFFILFGLAALFYFISLKENSAVSPERQFIPLIFNDTSTYVEVAGFSKEKIVQTIYNIVNSTKVKKGGLEGIYLINNKKSVGLREFVQLIKSNFVPGTEGVSGTLFVSDNFLIGVVNNETKDFFILLKTRSFADIFDAMHAWEGEMFNDLHVFFGIDLTPETKYLTTTQFQDGIVENKNVRVLYDKDKKIVMMYVLADDNSIIITNTEDTAYEIMLRLAASKVEK